MCKGAIIAEASLFMCKRARLHCQGVGSIDVSPGVWRDVYSATIFLTTAAVHINNNLQRHFQKCGCTLMVVRLDTGTTFAATVRDAHGVIEVPIGFRSLSYGEAFAFRPICEHVIGPPLWDQYEVTRGLLSIVITISPCHFSSPSPWQVYTEEYHQIPRRYQFDITNDERGLYETEFLDFQGTS
ncbi:uncharacterized protein EI90DRAFT_3011877 [Cantharellus anzutake]|uniref:uncharacterized protein n=1 Tax=Cantharellus anzutake TaxID=1750568 RepID=UPI0019037224|nr:uncharacterized protein EI90DRAFT_3011877 [Cantharellus anzutake]KAF8341237.1 hypothetical protein EI90DRAFT_3011877 [Cantharellus anzutake]